MGWDGSVETALRRRGLRCAALVAVMAAVTMDCAAAAVDLLVHLDDPHDLFLDQAVPATRDAVHTYLAARYSLQHVDVAAAIERHQHRSVDSRHDAAPTIESLWIQNTVLVRDAPAGLDAALAAMPGVRAVERDAWVYLDDDVSSDDMSAVTGAAQANVKLLHADEAWAKGFTGKGVTVASIDSGVRYSHDALARAYRGYVDGRKWNHDYAYWITASQPQTLTPENADEVGHGTHTTGTVVGANGVGVAPGATWIAARPFNADGSAKKSDILLAAQWVMCPTPWRGTKKDCSRGADIVSNSFGGNQSIAWMDKIVQTWARANMLPVFASGNVNGFQCGSVLCPGCLRESVAVGALIEGRTLWGGSGKGPGKQGVVKPDFVAPGVAIRSCASYDDHKYTRMTGTSMATPHVAGAAAILLQKCRSTKQGSCAMPALMAALGATAYQKLGKPILVPSSCGGTPYSKYPNNIYGHGMPNVAAAIATIATSPWDPEARTYLAVA